MVITEILKDLLLTFRRFNYDYDYYKWRSECVPKLEKYRDIHKGEDCFIIGGGPSLKHMDLNVLNDYHTFSLNRSNLLFDLFDIKFSYHVSVDDIVLDNIREDLKNNVFGCPSFVPYGILNNTDYIEHLFLEGPWTFHPDITKRIHTGNTVTYTAMQIAYFMGFKRVFLIGVDHNWKQSGEAHSKSVLDGEDENHFHPDYFKNKEWKAPDIYGNEVSYALAKYHYELDDRIILDATVNGKLQVFPKIEFADALKMAKVKF